MKQTICFAIFVLFLAYGKAKQTASPSSEEFFFKEGKAFSNPALEVSYDVIRDLH
jgi:hypothetical protein